MAGNIRFDASDFLNKVKGLAERMNSQKMKAVREVGEEVLRLSSFEVPHDTGMLQSSGSVQDGVDEVIVGYNKVYAARLHENPQYRFQKGRKGKYLEDPIKNNLHVFIDHVRRAIEEILK